MKKFFRPIFLFMSAFSRWKFFEPILLTVGIVAKLFVFALGLTTLVQIFGFFGWQFFKRADSFLSFHTARLVPFLPLEDGIGLLSSWATAGKLFFSVTPYFLIWIFLPIIWDFVNKRRLPDCCFKLLCLAVIEGIPLFGGFSFSIELFLDNYRRHTAGQLGQFSQICQSIYTWRNDSSRESG
ncbi:MAG: hypothetical protein AB1422_10080 [bacterium]